MVGGGRGRVRRQVDEGLGGQPPSNHVFTYEFCTIGPLDLTPTECLSLPLYVYIPYHLVWAIPCKTYNTNPLLLMHENFRFFFCSSDCFLNMIR